MRAFSTVLVASGLLLASCTQKQDARTILFTGDVLLDRGVATCIQMRGQDYVWQQTRHLFHQADAVIINLECPVTSHLQPVNKKYIFRASPDVLPAMKRAGVTHAALANNHTMDQGHQGLSDTDRLLRLHRITPLGYGHRPRPVYVVPGIAVLNALLMPVENWTFADNYADVCCTSVDSLVQTIQDFKARHPRHRLVALLHWGVEYQTRCTPRQILEAHRLIDAGADAVVGHHPHVLQNHEIYRGRPIYYSLGNFIFDSRRPETHSTAILSLTFTPDTITSRLHPMKTQGLPPSL